MNVEVLGIFLSNYEEVKLVINLNEFKNFDMEGWFVGNLDFFF